MARCVVTWRIGHDATVGTPRTPRTCRPGGGRHGRTTRLEPSIRSSSSSRPGAERDVIRGGTCCAVAGLVESFPFVTAMRCRSGSDESFKSYGLCGSVV